MYQILWQAIKKTKQERQPGKGQELITVRWIDPLHPIAFEWTG